MGLSLEFLIGPPKEMRDALAAYDYAALDRLTERKADFSLHLQPMDLQTLSDCAAAYANRPPKPFRTALTCYLDEPDCGFFLMDSGWTDAIASIDVEKSKDIAADWFAKMAEDYPDEQIGEPSAAAEQAVRDLIGLCQYGLQAQKPVIHIWGL